MAEPEPRRDVLRGVGNQREKEQCAQKAERVANTSFQALTLSVRPTACDSNPAAARFNHCYLSHPPHLDQCHGMVKTGRRARFGLA